MEKVTDPYLEFAQECVPNKGHGIDPITLITILSVVAKVVMFIIEWYNNDTAKAADSVKSPNILKRIILWRCIKKHIKKNNLDINAKDMYQSICSSFEARTRDKVLDVLNSHKRYMKNEQQ